MTDQLTEQQAVFLKIYGAYFKPLTPDTGKDRILEWVAEENIDLKFIEQAFVKISRSHNSMFPWNPSLQTIMEVYHQQLPTPPAPTADPRECPVCDKSGIVWIMHEKPTKVPCHCENGVQTRDECFGEDHDIREAYKFCQWAWTQMMYRTEEEVPTPAEDERV